MDADALSRNPWDMQVDTAIVKSIINEERSTQTPLYESYGPNTNLLHPEVVIAKGGYVTGIVPPELETAKATTMTREDWIAAQKQDPVLNQLITLIKWVVINNWCLLPGPATSFYNDILMLHHLTMIS